MAQPSASKWQADFQRARTDAAQAQSDLQRWELLADQNAPAGERGRQGAQIRAALGRLKETLDRLGRELEAMQGAPTTHEVTRKSLTQYGDELARVLAEVADMQRRAKGAAGAMGAGAQPLASPAGDFSRLSGAGQAVLRGRQPSGAELQPVSNRQLLDHHQQIIRSFDEPLERLDASVATLGEVTNVIHGEINLQNRMLTRTNESADAAIGRLSRVTRMLDNLRLRDRNRCLLLFIILLLIALVAIFIMVVTS